MDLIHPPAGHTPATTDTGRSDPDTCPTWCQTQYPDRPHHEAVLGQFGDGTVATVKVEQFRDEEPTLSVWSHVGAGEAERLPLAAADAVVLGRIFATVPPEDLIRFAHALTSGAALLGYPRSEASGR